MNVKAEKFDVLVADIEKSGNKWFTKDVIEGDEYNTVVYHGRLEFCILLYSCCSYNNEHYRCSH